MKKRVVITGLGAVTGLGEGAENLWNGVLKSQSAVEENILSDDLKISSAFFKDFSAEKFITQRKALKVMARDIQLAVAGASLAMEDARLKSEAMQPDRGGILVGAGVLNHELDELAYSIQSSVNEKGKLDLKKFGEDGLHALFPLWLLKYLPNMPACHISILFNLQGPSNTVTTGASAGLQAIGEAYRIIERGGADVMLAGGAESKVNPVGLAQYKVFGLLSELNGQDPKKLYKPFHKDSAGFVIGEGAGFLVLEELEHAKKRNAKIYAEVAGFGASSGSGKKTALESALRDAAIRPEQVDLFQACGLGLKNEDKAEAEVIKDVFKNHAGLSVSASKAVTGFTGFASGALDAVISTLSMAHSQIPAAMNVAKPDLVSDFPLVLDKAMNKKIKNVLTNSFGFHGQSASLVTKVFEN